MAIREFASQKLPRARVAFYEALPNEADLRSFKERRFECVRYSAAQLTDPSVAAELSAVIFLQVPDKRIALVPVLKPSIPILLNHGVRVYIRIAPDPIGSVAARQALVNELIAMKVPLANMQPEERAKVPEELREPEGSKLAPYVYLFDSGVTWTEIAHIVSDNPAGEVPNTRLKPSGMKSQSPKVRGEQLLLLRRAFADCESLSLHPMTDGLSGAQTYRAHSVLERGLGPKWPYPHFVKIGPRKRIIDEYNNYIGNALDYVPFHLGPRLRLERCNLGSSLGILVGDFVEGAEPIRDVASAGRVGQAIPNLFNKTLGPWRKQAEVDRGQTLGEHLDGKWLTEEDGTELVLPPDRIDLVRQLGADPLVHRLREIFLRYATSHGYCAPAHGDLHATNVLVRNGDAIIIDFEKMKLHYPLLYDAASLEGGLLVDSFNADSRLPRDFAGLINSIKPLYSLEALTGKYCACPPTDQSSWYFDCVTQIRAIAHHAEHRTGQYALVLALCLIRKGCNRHDFKGRKLVLRAIAFVLGQEILNSVEHNSGFAQP